MMRIGPCMACSASHTIEPAVFPTLVLASTIAYRAGQKRAETWYGVSHGRWYSGLFVMGVRELHRKLHRGPVVPGVLELRRRIEARQLRSSFHHRDERPHRLLVAQPHLRPQSELHLVAAFQLEFPQLLGFSVLERGALPQRGLHVAIRRLVADPELRPDLPISRPRNAEVERLLA